MDHSQPPSQYYLKKKYTVERPASCRLAPLNTSYSFSSHPSSSTASSTSSASQLLPPTGRRSHTYASCFSTPLSPSSAIILEEKSTLSPIQFPCHVNDQGNGRNQSHLAVPTTPPLSARSAAFLITLRHTLFSAVDAYAHRRLNHQEKPPSYQQTHFTNSKSTACLEEQGDVQRTTPLSLQRKIAVVFFGALMAISIILTVFLASNYRTQPRTAQHIIMGGNGSIIMFAAMLMLAAKRSIKEILMMAALSVAVCQCVMADLNSVL
jgi:hypothetical protein